MESSRDDAKLKLVSHKDHEEIYKALKEAIESLKQQSATIADKKERQLFEDQIGQLEMNLQSLNQIHKNQIETAVSKEKKIYGHPEKMFVAALNPKVSLRDLTSRVATSKKDAKESYNKSLEEMQVKIAELREKVAPDRKASFEAEQPEKKETRQRTLSRKSSAINLDSSSVSKNEAGGKSLKRTKSTPDFTRGKIVSKPSSPQLKPSSAPTQTRSPHEPEKKEPEKKEPDSPRRKF